MKHRILYCNHGVVVTWCPRSAWRHGGLWWIDAEADGDRVWLCVLGFELSIGRKRCAEPS